MFQRRSFAKLLALVLTLGLVAAACSDDDDGGAAPADTDATTTTSGDGQDGDDGAVTTAAPEGEDGGCEATVPGSEMNIAVFAPVLSLDPLQALGALTGGTDLAAIYDVLMRWNPETGEWEPHVAESLEPNDDFTEWTLTLREGVTYSNGETLTAQDVVDHMQRMLEPGVNASRAFLARVDFDNTEVVDDRTVVFRLFEPWATFGFALGDAPGMVVNPRVAAQTDSEGKSIVGQDPTGAGVGPYTVERWAPGDSPYLVLRARDDYWGGPVCIETVNMEFIPLDSTKADSLRLGEIDVAFMRTPEVIEELKSSGEFQHMLSLQSAGIMILINNSLGTANPITKDIRFRQAVNLALDPDDISERGYGGFMLRQDGLMHPNSRFYSEDVVEIERDPERAAELVEELKAEGWDGKIRLIGTNTVPDVPIAVEAALEAVGMDVDSTVTDTNTLSAAVIPGDYDLALWGWNISDSAAWRQLDFNFRSDSPSNRPGYANPEFDAAIDDFFAAADDDARKEVIARMSQIFAEDLPSAIFGAIEEGIIIRPDLKGIVETQQTQFLLHDAYYED